METISRKNAKALGLSRYFTGRPCPRGHIVERSVASYSCSECEKIVLKVNYARNRSARLASFKEWRQVNKEKANASSKNWAIENHALVLERVRLWRLANPERAKSNQTRWRSENKTHSLEYRSAWNKRNRDKCNAQYERRRAAMISATPAWADPKSILEVYSAACALSMLTGKKRHVDHIVPLRSKLVCGLHCEANLQILTGSENQTKSNRIWPNMPMAA